MNRDKKGTMMARRELFVAESPISKSLRKWEALVQLGDADPYAFVSVEEGHEERYTPETSGYKLLLPHYKRIYGNR